MKACCKRFQKKMVINPEGLEYQRVIYSVNAQRFILSNIESIVEFINID